MYYADANRDDALILATTWKVEECKHEEVNKLRYLRDT